MAKLTNFSFFHLNNIKLKRPQTPAGNYNVLFRYWFY